MNKIILSIKMFLCIVILLPMFAILLTIGSCKQKNKNEANAGKNSVSFEDIKIGYPDIEGQKKEMQKFSDIIDSKSTIEKPNEILRQMTEHVPLVFIETHLKDLSQKNTLKDRPNIFILLDQINDMQTINEPNTSEFIEKATENRNTDKLSVALFGLRTETQQAKAAEALASIGNSESVRLLTMRLLNAYGYPKGGSEDLIYRKELRRSLVKALGNCTGLDFSNYDASEAATLEIVKQCEDWLMKKDKKS